MNLNQCENFLNEFEEEIINNANEGARIVNNGGGLLLCRGRSKKALQEGVLIFEPDEPINAKMLSGLLGLDDSPTAVMLVSARIVKAGLLLLKVPADPLDLCKCFIKEFGNELCRALSEERGRGISIHLDKRTALVHPAVAFDDEIGREYVDTHTTLFDPQEAISNDMIERLCVNLGSAASSAELTGLIERMHASGAYQFDMATYEITVERPVVVRVNTFSARHAESMVNMAISSERKVVPDGPWLINKGSLKTAKILEESGTGTTQNKIWIGDLI
jgi:hypothetical protein